MAKRYRRDDVELLHELGLYVPSRTIYMGSESYSEDSESGTDGRMAEKFIKNITVLESMSDEPIKIIMNNCGGNVADGMAIYDRIRESRCEITIKVYGQAMSMGSVILQAADIRQMSVNSKQMIHYGSVSIQGDAKVAQCWAKESDRDDRWLEAMYLAKIRETKPDFTLAKLREMLKKDTILSAVESKELGLCDIVDGEATQ